MNISLSQLETFYWVARLKSFHAASRQQHLTQPTISARIHELETAIGYRLFERNAQGAELTPKGTLFLNKAEALLQLADDMVQENAAPMRGLLRLGSNESAALCGLGAFLTDLSARFPALDVELTVDVGSILHARLAAGGLDFAILSDPSNHPHIRDIMLGESEVCWVCAAGSVTLDGPLTPTDIAKMSVLTMPHPSSLHALMLSWFSSARVTPPHLNTCNSLSVMLKLVMSGIAVALLPRAILQRELDDGLIELMEVTHPLPALAIYVSFPIVGDTRIAEEMGEMARTSMLATTLLR